MIIPLSLPFSDHRFIVSLPSHYVTAARLAQAPACVKYISPTLNKRSDSADAR
jgi:hypothetical protein